MAVKSAVANFLFVSGAICLFVFVQPSYEHKYLGKENGSVTNAQAGLSGSPWLTYKSDSTSEPAPDSGLRLIARSWSWLFLGAGSALMIVGSRIARQQK